MIKMNKILLSCLLICSIGYPVICRGNKIKFQNGGSKHKIKDGDNCYTEEGKEGTCMALHKCTEISEIVKSRGGMQTKGTADIVRKRICGFEVRNARVCCLLDTIPKNPIIPTLDECGLTTIVKIHGTHPWLVGVGYLQNQNKNSIKVECGGTLITKRHILTAAHCFANKNIPEITHVILGEHSLSEETEREPPIILKIADKRNPGYNASLHYRDIELLTLEEDIEFSNYIFPACLPFEQYVKNFNFSNNMTIAGWGKTSFANREGTDRPMEAEVPLVPLEECKEVFQTFPNVFIDETQICLGQNGKDTCSGDSGGPVIFYDLRNTVRYFVTGITAFGIEECGHVGFPGVYTYVPEI
ncbi:Coagulation factor IX [Armadillidium nasatum]|uniref:CLIP domain-containing serine protease n=1 Tax=Armadillidium nasatum TaxID=96803 RepID=A0A5N5T6D0_9CRUS|nr:Coagulation factor IX [Armadillidium nasatum]